MRHHTLEAWLSWQEQLHPAEIELGLERVSEVFQRLHPSPPPFTLITVAGTNGKGSTVAMLEAILLAAGYRVGAYTSPHLLQYNERVRLQGEAVADERLCEAFSRVDMARGSQSLTYFEFGTLAALDIFYRQSLDVVILEVGMGGRLDAVNILDADVSIITNIGLDHQAWLGEDREKIGYEKSGIMRAGRPVICCDRQPPQSLLDHASFITAPLYRLGEDFELQREGQEEGPSWQWLGPEDKRLSLPLPNLRGEYQLDNAAGVVMALQVMHERLPVSNQAMREGLLTAQLLGRFQVREYQGITEILDVAHNPPALAVLAATLKAWRIPGRTLAVVGMLADKSIAESLAHLCAEVEHWYLAAPDSSRAATAPQMASEVRVACEGAEISLCETIRAALTQARQAAEPGDRILIVGSFYTVAEAMPEAV